MLKGLKLPALVENSILFFLCHRFHLYLFISLFWASYCFSHSIFILLCYQMVHSALSYLWKTICLSSNCLAKQRFLITRPYPCSNTTGLFPYKKKSCLKSLRNADLTVKNDCGILLQKFVRSMDTVTSSLSVALFVKYHVW